MKKIAKIGCVFTFLFMALGGAYAFDDLNAFDKAYEYALYHAEQESHKMPERVRDRIRVDYPYATKIVNLGRFYGEKDGRYFEERYLLAVENESTVKFYEYQFKGVLLAVGIPWGNVSLRELKLLDNTMNLNLTDLEQVEDLYLIKEQNERQGAWKMVGQYEIELKFGPLKKVLHFENNRVNLL